MNSSGYLKSFGWREGEALQKGGIKKPILVKHKNDKKGIGHQPNGGVDAWWERLFDGQLKAFDVKEDEKGLSFKQEKFVASGLAVSDSPLYRMFVRGETLGGTQGKMEILEIKRNSNGQATTDFTQIRTSFNKNGSKDVIPDKLNKEDTKGNKKSKKMRELVGSEKSKKHKKNNVHATSDTTERSRKKEKKVESNKEREEDKKKSDKKGRSQKKEKRDRPEKKLEENSLEKERKKLEKHKETKCEGDEKQRFTEKSSKKRKAANPEPSETESKKFKK